MLEAEPEGRLLQLLHPLLLPLALLQPAPPHRLVLVLLSAQPPRRLVDLQLQGQLRVHQAQRGDLLPGPDTRISSTLWWCHGVDSDGNML